MKIALRSLKPGWRGALLGLFCGLATWAIGALTVWQPLEERLQDAGFSFRGQRASRARLILIGLDAASFDALRKPAIFASPEFAEVIAYLKSQGVAAVGLDLLIPQSYASLPELQPGGVGDASRLGRAIVQAGNVVLPESKQDDHWLTPLPQWRLKEFLDPAPTDMGFVNWTEDEDYFLRRQQLCIRQGGQARLHFALALAARAQGVAAAWTENGLHLGNDIVPLDEDQRLRINYVGPPGTIPVVPLRDVLTAARTGAAAPADFAGAVVIIGATARDQQDYHSTPFAGGSWLSLYGGPWGLMSGSEIQANVTATLLDRAYLHATPQPVALALLLAAGALLGRLFARLNMTWGLALFALYHLGWRLVCLSLFALADVRLPVLPMLILGALAYGLTLLHRWRLLRLMLGVVKSDTIARLLEEDPAQLDLQGEDRVVTLLFADIRSFTSFAEQHSAREVVALLNAYFGAIVPIIERHGGTLNQYMGDGIMVIFGAPAFQPDHALRAVRAAVEVVCRVHALERRWAELGFPGLRTGVGVHTGRVVVGTVGSPHRLDYSAIGDTTNTASRIEGQNKALGTEILISGATYECLPEEDRSRFTSGTEPRLVAVKGREQHVGVYVIDAAKVAGAAPSGF